MLVYFKRLVIFLANSNNSFLSSYLFSPFFDTPETIEIKKYVQEMKKEEELMDIKINYVQVNNSDIFKQKLKLTNPVETLFNKAIAIISSMNFSSGGIYNVLFKSINIFTDNLIRSSKVDGNISIFIDLTHPKKSKVDYKLRNPEDIIKNGCTRIRKVLYHEVRHYMQEIYLDNSFESIVSQIETVNRLSIDEYRKYCSYFHDKYFSEIDADNYAINRCLEHYKNNPNDTSCDYEFLDKIALDNQYYSLIYDFDYFFLCYNKFRSSIPKFLLDFILSVFKMKDMLWLRVFYDDGKKIKNIDEIISHNNFREIDPKFSMYVFTSQYFNYQLDYSIISDEAKYILLNSFITMRKVVSNNLNKLFDYQQIKKKDILMLEKKLLFCESKINELTKLLSVNLNETKNGHRRS